MPQGRIRNIEATASLEDKMTIKMKQKMNEMKALVVTTPAPIKAVEEHASLQIGSLETLDGPSSLLFYTVVSNPQKGTNKTRDVIGKENPNLENTNTSSTSEKKNPIFMGNPKTEAKKTVIIDRLVLSDSGASINLLPHSIYKQLGLEALTPTRMTLELANRSISHPMGIAEDVVVRVDGFTFLVDFVVVNFEPDPRVPIILGRPFLRTAKALIDLYEETLTLRVGKEELVYYAEKSKKNKDKHFVHTISIIDFSKDDPFSGSTTTHSDDPSPSSSPVKTSDSFEEFADELAPLDSLPPVLLNTPLSDKVEYFTPEDDIDEIDAFLAIEVSSNFEEGYFDSEGDVTFLDNLFSDNATHNLVFEGISDHESEQNESSITFSPRRDPLHHEFAGELLTLPSRNDREFEEYLNLMTVLCEISTSQSQENIHQSSVIESLPVSPILVENSEPTQEEIDIFLVPDDLIPPGVENDDSENKDNELPNIDHQDDPSIPRPPPEPPNVEKCFEPEADLIFIFSFFSFGNEDTIFDPGIVTFHFEEVHDVDQEEKEFDLEDIFQIQDVILCEKFLKISRLISNIESLKDNPIPVVDSDSSDTFLSHSNNSLPEFESFSDQTEEARSGSTTTHANYSLPEYESFHFDPSFPRPPPEPPDVEICLHFEPDAPVIDNFNELNDDQRGK
ncbi:reverse transcriptase domain-containing protein [Tanacetum coccineum]